MLFIILADLIAPQKDNPNIQIQKNTLRRNVSQRQENLEAAKISWERKQTEIN
jgi:hypothetical protein